MLWLLVQPNSLVDSVLGHAFSFFLDFTKTLRFIQQMLFLVSRHDGGVIREVQWLNESAGQLEFIFEKGRLIYSSVVSKSDHQVEVELFDIYCHRVELNVKNQRFIDSWAIFPQQKALKQRLTILTRLPGTKAFIRDLFRVFGIIDTVHLAASILFFLQADGYQPVDQKISIPANWRCEMGVDGEVETKMSQVVSILVFYTLVSCHLETRKKLAVHNCVFVFTLGELFELVHGVV